MAPALQGINLYSVSAENLIVGTALQESRLIYLHQIGGPALGLMEIQPQTFTDIMRSIKNKPELKELVLKTCYFNELPTNPEVLIGNLTLSVIVARLIYLRDPMPLPPSDDIMALGAVYKKIYNTSTGKGTAEDFAYCYHQYAARYL